MALPLLIVVLAFGSIHVSDATTYTYKKFTTNYACAVTEGGSDLIGGLQNEPVTHDECRGNCSKYSWCFGVRITYDGIITGKRKKRGVHSEKCRLLTPNATITLDGWAHLNKDNWAKPEDWKKSFYTGYNCYNKETVTTSTNSTNTTTSTNSTTSTNTTTETNTTVVVNTTVLTPLPPIDCGPGATPERVDECSMCIPLNATGCRGDCKFTPDSMCVPRDWVHCGNSTYAEGCDMCNNKTGIANATGCDGDCEWTPDNTCMPKIPVDCGPGAVPDMVYSCSMCMPYNEMGCGAECKWTPSNSCIPFDWIHCGNGTYAKACDMCNAATGIANATGCEAVDGDCKWAPDNTCVLADPVADAMEKICELTDKLAAMEAQVAANAEKAEMNRKRHQNVDITFNKLCPLIDEVFDVASAPGGTRYDCCYESFKEDGNADGKVGQAMICMVDSFLGLIPSPPFEQTATGHCAATCGALPPEFAGN